MQDKVLLAYARAMQSAQVLEGHLKQLLRWYDYVCDVAATGQDWTNEKFLEALVSPDPRTFGNALIKLWKQMEKLGLPEFPESGRTGFEQLNWVRNFLAHQYFGDHSRLGDDNDSATLMVAELDSFRQAFDASALAVLIGIARASGGHVETWRDAHEFLESEGDSQLRDIQLARLRERLKWMGIDAPQVLAGTPGPTGSGG